MSQLTRYGLTNENGDTSSIMDLLSFHSSLSQALVSHSGLLVYADVEAVPSQNTRSIEEIS